MKLIELEKEYLLKKEVARLKKELAKKEKEKLKKNSEMEIEFVKNEIVTEGDKEIKKKSKKYS